MSDEADKPIIDLHRYLGGLIPPLEVVEALNLLVALPPELLMGEIQAWVREQREANPAIPVSDYFFHALRKIHLAGELELIDRGDLDRFLDWLLPLAVESSPHEERDRLRENLSVIMYRVAVSPTTPEARHQPAAPPSPIEPESESQPATQSLHRFTLIADRLARDTSAGYVAPQRQLLRDLAQLVILAAASASNWAELRDLMMKIPPLINPKEVGNIFQLLARASTSWEVDLPQQPGRESPMVMAAMQRIVALSRDELERAKRFRELLFAAVDEFNAGSLWTAVMMLRLAALIRSDSTLDKGVVNRICDEASDALDGEQLRRYVANKGRHQLLRKALRFFPSLSAEKLLNALRGEKLPEKRRAILAMIEAWGPEGRQAAFQRLLQELDRAGDVDTWFLRNTVFLLHRIRRESGDSVDEELEVLTRASSRERSIFVVKEAVTALGSIQTDEATMLLLARLAEYEALLLRGDESRGPYAEIIKVLDRIAAALARHATPKAIRAVVRHGLRTDLGDTRGRLSVLSQFDLSFDTQSVEMMLEAIRAELPGKILTRVLSKSHDATPKLIEALSGTKSDVVVEFLTDLAARFPQQELGQAAAAALTKPKGEIPQTGSDAPVAAAISPAGELAAYGLPELIHSLSELRASGVLTITDSKRNTAGRLVFGSGQILSAETDKLCDDEAFFQMIERPVSGFYAFARQEVAAGTDRALQAEATALLIEGLERYDRLGLTTALVPDHAVFKWAGVKPTPHPEEKDPAVMREVWGRATSGMPVSAWEQEIVADMYRVRRLVAHWLEEGSLEPALAAMA
ncbi:MAG TPA: DUF4388 domain-containing protein [Thermoanaerobaculia bacterium]|nr:DUF4388 domain-containing protein [Thermoanaerobaculia bacterium]